MNKESQNPNVHPEDEVLEDFVLGMLHVCRRVLVEAHLTFCESCRQRVSTLTAPAAAMLRAEPSAPASDALWARLTQQLDAENTPKDILATTPLPAGARSELPTRTTPLEWDAFGQGAFTPIAADPKQDMALFLVRSPAEIELPYHVHLGSEELVVLTGGYTDDFGHLTAGDFRSYGSGTAHAPIMDTGVTCWAVTLIVGGLQFGQAPTG